ncbi:MAG: hypothetical protein AB1568_00500 [Thermodesulfobacteriota bacterium]
MRPRPWQILLICALLPPLFPGQARAAACDAMHRLWDLSGASGQEVTVPFVLARKTQAITPVSGMDFKLVWDPTLLAVDHFQAGESCYGQFGCFPNLFPDCNPAGCTWGTLPTGHSIIAVPKNLADWRDRGVLMMVHLGATDIPLNSAYLDGNGQVIGDDQVVFTATFTLQADIPPENPATVWMAGASFAQTSGFTLHESVTDIGGSRVIVLDDQPPASSPPYAEAGPQQNVSEGATVTLDGSTSCDRDNDLATVQWTQTAGPPVTLAGADTAAPWFTAPNVGHAGATAVFHLRVGDGAGNFSEDAVLVHIADVLLPADLTDDGILDLADAIVGLRAAAGLPAAGCNVAADLDGDGRGGVAEAAYVLEHLSQGGG